MTQASDTPASQSIAARWTFYRRLGLLLRTRLDDEGATLSLHEITGRTHGRVSVSELTNLLAAGARAEADPVTCVLLAQALDVDPDFFVSDEAVAEYIRRLRAGATSDEASLQRVALAAIPAGREAVSAAR